MKRFVGLLVLLALIVGTVPLPVAAGPAPQMAGLARFFPADTPLYLALGTTEGDIGALDGVVQTLFNFLPSDEIPPGMDMNNLLDLLAFSTVADSFANGVRPWLGDYIAVGVLDLQGTMAAASDGASPPDPPMAIAIDVQDNAAFQTFFQRLLMIDDTLGALTPTEAGAFTFYDSDDPEAPVLVVGDGVFMIGNRTGIDTLVNYDGPTLLDQPQFMASLNLLPAPAYNLLMYLNADTLAALTTAQLEAESGMTMEEMGITVPPNAYPAMTFGLTVPEGRVLALDIAQPRDPAVSGDQTLIARPLPPLDLQFATNIPSDALITLMGSNFTALINMLEQTADMNIEQLLRLGLLDETPVSGFAPPDVTGSLADYRATLEELETQFVAETGLRPREDLVDWMTGSFAFYVRLEQDALLETPNPDTISGGLGFLVQVTDEAAMAHVGEQLSASLGDTTAEGLPVVREAIGEGNAFVVDVPSDGSGEPDMSLAIGTDYDVFVFGTRDVAEAAFASDYGGLAADQRFREATRYLLPNSSVLAYLNLNAVREGLMMTTTSADDAANMRLALDLLHSVTLSSTTFEDGSIISRVGIMLGTMNTAASK